MREVARSLAISVGTAQKTAARAGIAGVTWAVAESLSETEVTGLPLDGGPGF